MSAPAAHAPGPGVWGLLRSGAGAARVAASGRGVAGAGLLFQSPWGKNCGDQELRVTRGPSAPTPSSVRAGRRAWTPVEDTASCRVASHSPLHRNARPCHTEGAAGGSLTAVPSPPAARAGTATSRQPGPHPEDPDPLQEPGGTSGLGEQGPDKQGNNPQVTGARAFGDRDTLSGPLTVSVRLPSGRETRRVFQPTDTHRPPATRPLPRTPATAAPRAPPPPRRPRHGHLACVPAGVPLARCFHPVT